MECLLLQLSENRSCVCRGRVEVQSAKRKCPSAVSVGQQAEVADLDEAEGRTWSRKRRINSTASNRADIPKS